MRRIRTALAFAAIVLAFGVQSAQPAEAAVPPVPYTGSVNIDYLNNGSAGGVLQRGDRYYLMTVAHIAGPLYTQHSVVKPGTYPLGGTAYNASSGSAPEDIALIELGTTRPSPRMRVCNAVSCPTPPGYTVPQVATIESTPTCRTERSSVSRVGPPPPIRNTAGTGAASPTTPGTTHARRCAG
jgi:hypothetical protein